jgi:hypothetical protein
MQTGCAFPAASSSRARHGMGAGVHGLRCLGPFLRCLHPSRPASLHSHRSTHPQPVARLLRVSSRLRGGSVGFRLSTSIQGSISTAAAHRASRSEHETRFAGTLASSLTDSTVDSLLTITTGLVDRRVARSRPGRPTSSPSLSRANGSSPAACTNTARYATRPLAPLLAGAAIASRSASPSSSPAPLKTVYDLGLYAFFRRVPLAARDGTSSPASLVVSARARPSR